MATGTAAGLLDEPGGHPQSVLKHAILRRYLQPFVMMTGSRSPDHRVLLVDGYAGTGRYTDDSPGSAELLLKAAEGAALRQVEAMFVEGDAGNFARLEPVVAEYVARGVRAMAFSGRVEEHLAEVQARAVGIPLFLFLDPCGAVVPFDVLAALLSTTRGPGEAPTEVLLNFSAGLTKRTVGALLKGRLTDPSVAALDRACGGTWWQEIARQEQSTNPRRFEIIAEKIAVSYAQRLQDRAGGGASTVVVPVRKRHHHQPIYHLVMLTRSRYGLWLFADAVAVARQAWMRELGAADDDEVLALFSTAESAEEVIVGEQARAQDRVAANLKALLPAGRGVKLVEVTREVFGDDYGVVTESTVRAAVRRLQKAGELEIQTPEPKQLRDFRVRRAGPGAGG